MLIKILGTGCAKCNRLEQLTMEIVAEMKLTATFEHVTEMQEIMAYQVMSTPALVIDDEHWLDASSAAALTVACRAVADGLGKQGRPSLDPATRGDRCRCGRPRRRVARGAAAEPGSAAGRRCAPPVRPPRTAGPPGAARCG